MAGTSNNEKSNVFKDFDFIKAWIKVISQYTDANPELIEATGLYLLSTLIGHKAWINSVPDINPFAEKPEETGLKLNIYTLIIGRTARSRKSTVIKKVEEFIKRVKPEILMPRLMTPEALKDELEIRKEGSYSWGTWIVDEVAELYELARKKDYMASMQSLLQILYDGAGYSASTITRGKVLTGKVYFTFLGASTEILVLNKLIRDEDFVHGFLGRFIIIYDKGTRNRRPRRFETPKRDPMAMEIVEWALNLLSIKKFIILQPTPEAEELINEIESKNDEEISKLTNLYLFISPETKMKYLLGLYCSRLTTNLLKLAGLYRISRLALEDLKRMQSLDDPNIKITVDDILENPSILDELRQEIIFIEKQDVERAWKFLSKIVVPSVEEIVKLMHAETLNFEIQVSTVKVIIKKYGTEIDGYPAIDRTTLYKKWFNVTKLPSEYLEKVLKHLRAEGSIREITRKTSGRPKTFYVLKEE